MQASGFTKTEIDFGRKTGPLSGQGGSGYDTYRYLNLRADSLLMRDKNLRQLGPGFYMDDKNVLYFDVREFLEVHGLPDRIEVRRAVWEEVRRDFGAIGISSIFPTEEEEQ